MLRKITLSLNILVVLVSSCLFAYTFFAKEDLTTHARAFVNEKTLDYSKPAIELVEQFIESPITSTITSAEKKQAIAEEVARYWRSPPDYITSLTAEFDRRDVQSESGRVGQFKQKIRKYYQTTLRELIFDLRVFTASNIVAGLFGIFLFSTARIGHSKQVQIFSLAIFMSVVMSSFLYIDRLSFFRILFKWHMGWSYPVTIGTSTFHLYSQYKKSKKQRDGARHLLPLQK